MLNRLSETLEEDLDHVALLLRAVTVVVRSSSSGRGRTRQESSGQGAGVVWSPDGTIVTNAHVATGDSAAITLADGRTADARLVARDRRRDLALLRVDTARLGGSPLPTPVLGDPSTLRPGDVVVGLGHPLGVEHAFAMGVVHAAPDVGRTPYIVADIRLAPGNSGGPLADARGRIVGVNSMIVGGLGVAVSVDAVRSLVAAATPRPVLGVELRPVRVRVPVGSPTTSVAMLVTTLDPRGAAARAGIRQGDLLLGHAGRAFRSPAELPELLRDAGSESTLRFDVGRGGRQIVCEVRLGAADSRPRRAA
ncbi:MAG: S1C family serine protease [Gemmatimonadaceae bacterium]